MKHGAHTGGYVHDTLSIYDRTVFHLLGDTRTGNFRASTLRNTVPQPLGLSWGQYDSWPTKFCTSDNGCRCILECKIVGSKLFIGFGKLTHTTAVAKGLKLLEVDAWGVASQTTLPCLRTRTHIFLRSYP